MINRIKMVNPICYAALVLGFPVVGIFISDTTMDERSYIYLAVAMIFVIPLYMSLKYWLSQEEKRKRAFQAHNIIEEESEERKVSIAKPQ